MNKININVFSYEDKIIYPIYLSNQFFNDVLDLLLINNHYVLIKDFNRLMFNKTKSKNKKWFCKSCLQCFSSENILNNHKKNCLLINGRQRIKLEKGFIEFNNFNKMIPCPFKIYADFECLLKNVDIGINNDCFSYTAKFQNHIPCSFACKLVCIDDKFSKDVVLFRGKNAIFRFIQSIFGEYSYCKSIIKKNFNKNLIMSSEEEEQFEKTEICWICNKLIENDNKDCFLNSLKDCYISDEEYCRAIDVWNIFNIKNLGEYHDLYLKTDVLLLCDVFEKFVDVCLGDYGLDPCHYFSSPGLAWNAMLKMTGIKLEKENDIDMYLFLEKGMRGGI